MKPQTKRNLLTFGSRKSFDDTLFAIVSASSFHNKTTFFISDLENKLVLTELVFPIQTAINVLRDQLQNNDDSA